jgi:hypothetical protein
MLPDWALQYKEKGTEIKLINGRYYKYQTKYRYDPLKKRSVRAKTVLLGSITERKGFVPSEVMREALENPHYDTKSFGPFAVFQSMIPAEIQALQDVFEPQMAERILVCALMRWAFKSPIKRVALRHSQSFCSEIWCRNEVLNDKKITETLNGANRAKVVQWMKKLLPQAAEHLLLMDSTHFFSASENITTNEIGYNPHRIFEEQIRLMYMFSANFKRPIYFRPLNGNLTDVTTMKQCIDEMEFGEKITIVADKGFYSQANLANLKSQGLQYVVPVPRNDTAIDYAPFLSGDFEKTRNYFLYQKRIIWFHEYNSQGKRYVTFLDERLRGEERQDFFLRKEQSENESQKPWSEEDFDREFLARRHTFGTLTLAVDLAKECSAREIYEIYKQRNEIEVMFDGYKNFLEADKSYMQDRFVLDGWLFVNFIAMLAYYKLYDRLRQKKLLKKISPTDVLGISKGVYQNWNQWQKQWIRTEITQPKAVRSA